MILWMLLGCAAVHSSLDRAETRAAIASPADPGVEHRRSLTVLRDITIDAPPTAVWAVVSDMDAWHQWAPSISESQTEAGRPLREGDAFTFVPDGHQVAASTLTADGEVLRFHGRIDGKLYGVWTFTLTDLGGKTRVVLREDFSAWFLHLVGWAGTFGIREGIDKTLHGLKDRVEGTSS